MPRKIDLIGQHFNQLTVIKETDKRNASGCILWECKCSCGNITYAASTELKNGHKKSCGCLQKIKAGEIGRNNLIDISGKKFGKLTVIKKMYSKKTTNNSTKIYWLCQCDCGQSKIIEGNALKQGNTTSCGCIKSLGEQKIANILNDYNISYVREKIFQGTSFRYDFYVNNEYIIEYDGIQHFQDYSWGDKYNTKEKSQKRDMEKNLYCQKNNIPIIRIPYTHFDNINIQDLLLETSHFIIKSEIKKLGDE